MRSVRVVLGASLVLALTLVSVAVLAPTASGQPPTRDDQKCIYPDCGGAGSGNGCAAAIIVYDGADRYVCGLQQSYGPGCLYDCGPFLVRVD